MIFRSREDASGKRCRDDKTEPSFEWEPNRNIKPVLDPVDFSLWIFKPKRKISKPQSVFLKYPTRVWSLK